MRLQLQRLISRVRVIEWTRVTTRARESVVRGGRRGSFSKRSRIPFHPALPRVERSAIVQFFYRA